MNHKNVGSDCEAKLAGYWNSCSLETQRGSGALAMSKVAVSRMLILSIVASGGSVIAADFSLGDAKASLKGTVTYGTLFRDSDRDPELINRLNAATLGVVGIPAPNGRNSDDGNLNFAKGDPVSQVLKVYAEGTIAQGDWSILLSGKAWHDYVLNDKSLPWGNTPNGFSSNVPISSEGFGQRGKFSSAVLQSAYVQNNSDLDNSKLRVRLGKQTVNWGINTILGGGLANIDASDAPATRRPGTTADENRIPAAMLRSTWTSNSGISADAFAQLQFEANQSTICGTFYSVADYLDGGCDKALVGGATAIDSVNIQAGNYLKRSGVVLPENGGQFGASLTYASPDKTWNASLYAANIHNRALSYNMIKGRRATGNPALPNDPGGLNPMYEIEYAKNVNYYGLDLTANTTNGTVYGSVFHSPNLPVPLNAGDLIGAFASLPTVPGLLRADERATPLGGWYRGYDRLNVSNLTLGYSKTWAKLGDVARVSVQAEIGGRFVHDLPDVTVRRYRRPDVYGNGPVAGACTGTEKQCSNNGYVTQVAYGIRLRGSFTFSLTDQLKVTPSLTFGSDLKGYAYDLSMGEGRHSIDFRTRLTQGSYFADFVLSRFSGNPYDNGNDRDSLGFVLGATF
jgi:hypothetical protein